MDINRMKLGLMYIFKESSLSNKSKLHLINFIENASMYQLKALALDGALVPNEQLTEKVCERVDERFDGSDKLHESLRKASLEAMKSAVKRKS